MGWGDRGKRCSAFHFMPGCLGNALGNEGDGFRSRWEHCWQTVLSCQPSSGHAAALAELPPLTEAAHVQWLVWGSEKKPWLPQYPQDNSSWPLQFQGFLWSHCTTEMASPHLPQSLSFRGIDPRVFHNDLLSCRGPSLSLLPQGFNLGYNALD